MTTEVSRSSTSTPTTTYYGTCDGKITVLNIPGWDEATIDGRNELLALVFRMDRWRLGKRLVIPGWKTLRFDGRFMSAETQLRRCLLYFERRLPGRI